MGGILCIPNFIPPCIGNIRISLSTFNTLNTRYFCLRYLEHQDLFQTLDSGPLFWTTMGPIPSPSHGKSLVFYRRRIRPSPWNATRAPPFPLWKEPASMYLGGEIFWGPFGPVRGHFDRWKEVRHV